MVDYTKLAATAKRLIEANGRTITLYRRDRTPANASEPWRGPSSTPAETIAVVGVVVPPRGTGLSSIIRDLEGSLVKAFDEVALIATDSVVAAGSTAADVRGCDSVSDGSRAWKIEVVEELAPGGTSLIFALGLKS